MTVSGKKEGEVAREIAGLTALERESLVARWRAVFGSPSPRKLSRALLEKALAYEIQCAAFGGLSTPTKRTLRAAASESGQRARRHSVSAGARLVRERNGVTHEVEVTEGGYVWRGETYRSLTAIACRITGTKWSGPRFFGLTGRS